MKKRIFLYLIALFISIFLVMPAQAGDVKPIKIGFLHSLSGGIGQVYGIPDLAGAKIAVREINKQGGILGRPLEIIARDDKLSPEVGVRQVKDLILNEKVDWLMGTVSSSVALAASAYCAQSKVIWVVTNAQSAGITGGSGNRYTFRISTNTTNYTSSIAYGVAKYWPNLKKVFILGPDYEYGHRSKKDFMHAYTKLVPGAEVVGELWPKLGNKDWTSYIATIMNSDADFVYCSLWGGDVLSFTKTANGFGYFDKVKHCGQDWGNIEVLGKMTKSVYPKGAIGGSHYPFWLIDNPISNALWPAIKKETEGMYPGVAGTCSYATIYAMKKAIEKAGTVNTEKMIEALEGLTFEAPVGPITIRACDHQAMWPFWVGKIDTSDKLPWPHITDAVLPDPEKGYQSCDEVAADRKLHK